VVGFVSIGALILDRRPGEPVGRICLGIGLLFCVGTSLRLVVLLIDAQPGPLPESVVVGAVVASILVNLAILLGGPLLISRFPQRSGGRRQRLAEDLLLVLTGVAAVVSTTQPALVDYEWITVVPNPLHVEGFPVGEGDLFTLAFLTYALTYVVTTIGLLARYRSGGAVVRAQIRWFGASVALSLAAVLLILIEPVWNPLGEYAWGLWIMSLLLPPIGIAIAILRYRLFDIDRIISKAIGYGVVTVVLFAVFATVNLVLVSQVSPLVNNESVAVAASTLVVAGMFNPLRTRVQRGVDRRFDRARFDADRTTAAFSERLRDEVDIASVTTDLDATVQMALRPASLGLWLRRGTDG